MKKRTAVSGLVAVGVVLGVILSGIIPSFKFGGVGGDAAPNSAPSDVPAEDVMATVPSPKNFLTASIPQTDEANSEEPNVPADVVDVLIDGHTYSIRRGGPESSDYQSIELTSLVEKVKETPGNDEGIRIRISRTESARASTEMDLQDALVAAGLRESAISWQKQLVE
jgi:hypothetical protein